MSGRLIQRFKARLYRLDTDKQTTGGYYDEVFREPVKVDATGDGIGEVVREERVADVIPCQVGNRQYENRNQTDLGNDPDSTVTLRFHARNMENMGLFDVPTGRPLIQVGTRLDAILDYWTEDLVLAFPEGCFCEECEVAGWGLNMARPQRNLVRAVFRRRKKAAA